jgi:hypothetical protein
MPQDEASLKEGPYPRPEGTKANDETKGKKDGGRKAATKQKLASTKYKIQLQRQTKTILTP